MKQEPTHNGSEAQGQADEQGPAQEARRQVRRKADGQGQEGVLTPKQEAFVAAYLETGNATEAYRRAYDAENMQDHVIRVKACELMKNGNVAVTLLQRQAEARQRHEITLESITEMLKADRELARTEKQSSAAIQAAMGLAKLHGLVVDKSENKNQNNGTVMVTWANATH